MSAKPHGPNPKDPWIPQYLGCTIALQGNGSVVLVSCLISPHQAGPGFDSWDVLTVGEFHFGGPYKILRSKSALAFFTSCLHEVLQLFMQDFWVQWCSSSVIV